MKRLLPGGADGCIGGRQVSSKGEVAVESGVGARGTSLATLSGGKPLGPDGALRLADLLREAPPSLLTSLDLRHLITFITLILPPMDCTRPQP